MMIWFHSDDDLRLLMEDNRSKAINRPPGVKQNDWFVFSFLIQICMYWSIGEKKRQPVVVYCLLYQHFKSPLATSVTTFHNSIVRWMWQQQPVHSIVQESTRAEARKAWAAADERKNLKKIRMKNEILVLYCSYRPSVQCGQQQIIGLQALQ